MEYEWLLFVFLGFISWQLIRLNFLLGGFIVGLAKLVRVIEKGEIRDLTDEMFVREYNKYREEALRRAK
jgi:protein-S-isoprenylcysteine O-methyltransferase Ste14